MKAYFGISFNRYDLKEIIYFLTHHQNIRSRTFETIVQTTVCLKKFKICSRQILVTHLLFSLKQLFFPS